MVNKTPIQAPDKLKVVELRAELAARGLDTKGNKPVLVERLKIALEDEDGSSSPTLSETEAAEQEKEEPSDSECEPAVTSAMPTTEQFPEANKPSLSNEQSETGDHTVTRTISNEMPTEEQVHETEKQGKEVEEQPTSITTDDLEEKESSSNTALTMEQAPEVEETDIKTKEPSESSANAPAQQLETGQDVGEENPRTAPTRDSRDDSTIKIVPEDLEEQDSEAQSADKMEDNSTNSKAMESSIEDSLKESTTQRVAQEEADDSVANASTAAVYGGRDDTILDESVLNQTVNNAEGINDSVELPEKQGEETHFVENTEVTDLKMETETAKALDDECADVARNANLSIEIEDAKKESTAEGKPEAEEEKMEVEESMSSTDKIEAETSKADQTADKVKLENNENGVAVDDKESKSKRDRSRDRSRRSPARKRDRRSSERSDKRTREPSPELRDAPEEEPECDPNAVLLDWANSDLNLVLDKETLTTASPLTEGGFVYAWAGARATYGFAKGKVCFEVKVLKHLEVPQLENEAHPHIIRIGWSTSSSSLQLGEAPFSFGYDGTGKLSCNSEFKEYGKALQEGDVIGAYLNFGEEQVTMEFTVNGESQGIATSLSVSECEEKALYPHVLTKNCRFEVNFGQNEEPWHPLLEDYALAGKVELEDRVKGISAPSSRQDCEIIMMCGLPSCGKTTWASKYAEEHADKRYNIIGTSTLIDRMKVDGQTRRSVYQGKWEALIEKCTRCVNTLLDIAAKRRRNYILDQTNVYPNVQRRKLSQFKSFRRLAVVLVPSNEEYLQRVAKRESEEGKSVPDSAVMEMKANFRVPDAGTVLFPTVEYVELGETEAKEVVNKYNEEGRKAGFGQNASSASKKPRNDRDRDQDRDSRHSSSSRSHGRRRSSERDSKRSGGGSYKSSQSYNRDRRRDDYRPRDRYDSKHGSSRDNNDRRDRYGGGGNYRSQSSGNYGGGRNQSGYSSGKYGGGGQGGYQQSYGYQQSRGGNRGAGFGGGGYNDNYGGSSYGNYGNSNYTGSGSQNSGTGTGYGNYYQTSASQGQYFQGSSGTSSGQAGSWASYGQQPAASGEQPAYGSGYGSSYGAAPK